ncbi:MAG: PAS domain S-box protein [Alphaproteobacteria bacterium]|nr:PAS domain S-box protein [Alphaproteobacteria bacterium]
MSGQNDHSDLAIAQQRIAQLERDLAQIERTVGIGYWRWQLGDPKPTWSRGMRAIAKQDDVPNNPDWLRQQLDPSDQAMVASTIAKAFASGEPFFYRVRDRGQTGAIRYYDTYGDCEVDPTGRVTAIVGVVQDVTSRVESKAALVASEAQFRHLAEEASDVISRHAADGTCLYISPSCERVMGFKAEELIGQRTIMHVNPQDVDLVSSIVDGIQRSDTTALATYRFQRGDGQTVWLESAGRRVAPEESDSAGEFVVVTRDVTARKRVERELEEARERAETANQTKSRFLANMSHELRTPLNAIIGFSDILLQELFGPIGQPRYQEYAQLIHESGQLLLELISDILDMSKIEAGKYELHYEECDARELVEAVTRLIQGRAEDAGVMLGIALPEEPITLRADKRAVKQVIINLLSNAIKFTPGGGQVTVNVKRHDNFVIIAVTDTGIGIAPEDLPRLGHAFEQAKADSDLAKVGTGLGLALVRSLSQLHGGSMRIESALGIGTTVTVTLPLSREAVGRPAVA